MCSHESSFPRYFGLYLWALPVDALDATECTYELKVLPYTHPGFKDAIISINLKLLFRWDLRYRLIRFWDVDDS